VAGTVIAPAYADSLLNRAARTVHHVAKAIGDAAKDVARGLEVTFGEGSYGVKKKKGVGVGLSLAEGPPDTELTVTASGLPHDADVALSAGPSADNTKPLATGKSDVHGKLTSVVHVPSDAKPGDKLVFVVQTTDKRVQLVSGEFHVTAATPPDAKTDAAEKPASNDKANGEKAPATATITVVGTLSKEGTECQALRGDDGQLYTFATSKAGGFVAGDRVRVEGTKAEVSICMQGITISVTSISKAK
jgi:hypothetical protein